MKKYTINNNKFHIDQLLETMERHINTDHKFINMIEKLESKMHTDIKDIKFEVNCRTEEIDSRTSMFVNNATEKMTKLAIMVENSGNA